LGATGSLRVYTAPEAAIHDKLKEKVKNLNYIGFLPPCTANNVEA